MANAHTASPGATWRLSGRPALLAATRTLDWRLATGDGQVHGYRRADTVVWVTRAVPHPAVSALGNGLRAAATHRAGAGCTGRRPGNGRHTARARSDTMTRPGDPRIRRWFGIWDDDVLVACAADRSRGGVGSNAGITVHPDWRGHGLGAALTAAVTARLHAEFGLASLGVLTDNRLADQLYRRLGYVNSTERTSVLLTGGARRTAAGG